MNYFKEQVADWTSLDVAALALGSSLGLWTVGQEPARESLWRADCPYSDYLHEMLLIMEEAGWLESMEADDEDLVRWKCKQ